MLARDAVITTGLGHQNGPPLQCPNGHFCPTLGARRGLARRERAGRGRGGPRGGGGGRKPVRRDTICAALRAIIRAPSVPVLQGPPSRSLSVRHLK